MIGRLHASVLARLVAATVAVGVAMSVVVIFVLSATTRPAALEQVTVRNAELAAGLATTVNDRVAASVRMLQLAALDERLTDGPPAARTALHVYLRVAGTADQVVLLDADGRGVAAASVSQILEPARVPAVGEAPIDTPVRLVADEDGEHMVEVSMAVEDPPGVRVGTLVAWFRLDVLATQLESTRAGDSGAVFLIDDAGQILVHPDRDRVVRGDHIELPAATLSADGGSAVRRIDGDDVILAVAPILSLPARVVVQQTQAAALASLGPAIGQLTKILLLVIAAMVVTLALVGHRLLRPLRSLAVTVQRFGHGDRSARVNIDRPDEIGHVARTFDEMAHELEQQWERVTASHTRLVKTQERLEQHVVDLERAHEALASSEERFRQLTEHISELFWMLDARTGEVLYVSPAFSAITGLDPQTLYEDPASFLEIVHPEDIAELPSALEGLSDHDTEYRIVRGDGEIRWLWSRSFAVPDERGRVYRVAGITEDVTDRKRAEATLRESEQRLRALDEMKNSFLTAVSHELRTPLAAVIGFADTLESRHDELVPEQRHEFVGRIARNARKLQALLSDLLDVDRLERGIVAPRRRTVDVTETIRDVVGSTDLLTGHPVHVDPGPAAATIDPTMVERIVENLLANAARHTPGGTEIWVRARSQDTGVEIVVEDAGPGVPDALKDAIFEPFRQGHDEVHSPGVGVGLALVARFAELHGGRAWVEDRPGGGACFHVVLTSADELEIASAESASRHVAD